MPLDAVAISQALEGTPAQGPLTLHHALCRRDAPMFQQAIKQHGDVLVACTQEQRLLSELAEHTEGARAGVEAPIRFVNIREAGGWSRDAKFATPKLAALIAMASLPAPEPVAQVSYQSSGRLLIIGSGACARQAAQMLGDDGLQTTVLLAPGFGVAGASPSERTVPVLSGELVSLTGWLGAFELVVQRNNPIDLDLCTGCNACVAACPESAIGPDFQVDLDRCKGHRACVSACAGAQAIDFKRVATPERHAFDLVLDLREAPAFAQHAKPQGYFYEPLSASQPSVRSTTAIALTRLVGEFDKPKFFAYKQKLCAHSRNTQIGCRACIDVCSAQAISSDAARQQIKVNPNLCVGCGACSTVCPTGAIAFQYPKAADVGQRIKVALQTYLRSGGQGPSLLFHSAGQQLLMRWGQRAKSHADVRGVPANVLPVALHHVASAGLEVWLAAYCYGAAEITVLTTEDDAPQYRQALQEQLALAQSLIDGMGHPGVFRICHVAGDSMLHQSSNLIAMDRYFYPATLEKSIKKTASHLPPAKFALAADKRTSLELLIEHLLAHAPAPRPDAAPIALPTGSPWGALAVDTERCTLCLSCVNACPAAALSDGQLLPQLNFTEKNCVQCGLCATTCPENAIKLVPQLSVSPMRKQARVLAQMQPYCCVRCQKPFGTLKAIEAMLGKLAGHSMFQGAAAERLKMCMDCRVVDLYSAADESKITDL